MNSSVSSYVLLQPRVYPTTMSSPQVSAPSMLTPQVKIGQVTKSLDAPKRVAAAAARHLTDFRVSGVKDLIDVPEPESSKTRLRRLQAARLRQEYLRSGIDSPEPFHMRHQPRRVRHHRPTDVGVINVPEPKERYDPADYRAPPPPTFPEAVDGHLIADRVFEVALSTGSV